MTGTARNPSAVQQLPQHALRAAKTTSICKPASAEALVEISMCRTATSYTLFAFSGRRRSGRQYGLSTRYKRARNSKADSGQAQGPAEPLGGFTVQPRSQWVAGFMFETGMIHSRCWAGWRASSGRERRCHRRRSAGRGAGACRPPWHPSSHPPSASCRHRRLGCRPRGHVVVSNHKHTIRLHQSSQGGLQPQNEKQQLSLCTSRGMGASHEPVAS